MDSRENNLEEIPVNYTCYRFTELRDQKWVKFVQGNMPTRDTCLKKFSAKYQNQVLWEEDEWENTSEEEKVGKAITETLKSGIWIVRDSILSWKVNYGKTATITTEKC